MSTRSLSYNCGSYPLPQELTGLVMENLARDRPSLSASSLVCHSWSKESSRVLFRVLIAGGPPGMGDGLLELVKNSERVRTNIRSLGLSSGNGPSDKPEDYELFSFDKLLQILGYLPRIKSLSFWSLRLKWDTEEPTGLSEFKSTRREFTQLSLWNVPNDPATMSCYTQLISSIRKITCLNVTSGVAMHERPLPTAAATHQAQPSISTSVVPVPTSPLRIENLTVNDGCFSDRYLEWFDCSHNLSINPHKITSFRTTLWPRILRQLYEYHNDRSTSSIPCAVKLIESFTHICFLSLDIGFLASTSELTDSAGVVFKAKLPDLSGLRRLQKVSVRSILIFNTGGRMNRSLFHNRHSLRKMWKMLVQMLRTTSPRLERIDLHFKPFKTSFLDYDNPAFMLGQVYDWSLLCKLVSERKNIKYIALSACGTEDEVSHFKSSSSSPSRSNISGVWRRYPRIVRIIQSALQVPKTRIVELKFLTETERRLRGT